MAYSQTAARYSLRNAFRVPDGLTHTARCARHLPALDAGFGGLHAIISIVLLSEADTGAKLIDPAIHERGWTEDLICRETTLGQVEIIGGKPRRRSAGRTDYTLRVRVATEDQPVAVALIEAKKEGLPPGHGLDQAKGDLDACRHNVQFVFSSNGHLFVEYNRTTGMTSVPRPLSEFPSPADLRGRYEQIAGFSLEDAIAKPLLTRYVGGEGQRRYFQDAAIRAVFEKVANSGAKEARENTSKTDDIENAVYDLKAVNPNRRSDVDTRTPAELLDLIEAKGREVTEALSRLRALNRVE